jgi:sterol desaturase/sphingolipid hydroxylase (fatty acid hydroxylase superfamily)
MAGGKKCDSLSTGYAAGFRGIFVVYLYSTFVHANLNGRFPITEEVLVTPRFHHWHHGVEKEAIDVNFAIHFPIFDRLFGAHHLPKDRWPSGCGLEGNPAPLGCLAQLKYPFQREQRKSQSPPVKNGS